MWIDPLNARPRWQPSSVTAAFFTLAQMKRPVFIQFCLLLLASCLSADESREEFSNRDRSPVDLVVSPGQRWLATANQTSGSVSLVRIGDGVVLDEVAVGQRPSAIAILPDGRRLIVSASDSGDVVVLEVRDDRLLVSSRIHVGFEPHGIAVNAAGNKAYVALTADAKVAVIDLRTGDVLDRIVVGRWPRYLALSPDETRLAIGTSGDRGISIVDTEAGKLLFIEKFVGLNIGHLRISRDSKYAYFPWVVYRQNPITAGNIRLGWVLATRIARVKLREQARREAMSLDPRGEAIADPHGLALTSDEKRLVVSASGSHELLVYRATDLPLEDFGGTDHIPNALLRDDDRFFRIELGGRPMGLCIAKDDRTVYVANYLNNSVQIVDIAKRRLVRSIPLGGPAEPSLARRGEAIFFDGRRSLDQWYSCHTCHYDGGTNAVAMDTLNDHSSFTFKTVLPLYNVAATGPWTWHGWQADLQAAMKKSMTSTMLGPNPSDADVKALVAYLKTLRPPPNPFRQPDGSLSESAKRGKRVFESTETNCTSCHSGPLFTDGEVHDVGTGKSSDRLQGFNTPSLIGVFRKVELLHDGRAKSLHDLLTDHHAPEKVAGEKPLSGREVVDLIEYLKTL